MQNDTSGFGSSVLESRPETRDEPMKKPSDKMNDELRPEYDLSPVAQGGVRGEYANATMQAPIWFSWTRTFERPFAAGEQ
jgi:hypothetical protein